jgi:hypothetical protein
MMRTIISIVLCSIFFACSPPDKKLPQAEVPDEYPDEVSIPVVQIPERVVVSSYVAEQAIKFEAFPCGNRVLDLAAEIENDGILIIGDAGVCRYHDGAFETLASGRYSRFDRGLTNLTSRFLVNSDNLYQVTDTVTTMTLLPESIGEVHDLQTMQGSEDLLLSCAGGLFLLERTNTYMARRLYNEEVTAAGNFLTNGEIYFLTEDSFNSIDGAGNVTIIYTAEGGEVLRDFIIDREGEITIAGSDGPIVIPTGGEPQKVSIEEGPPIRDLNRIFRVALDPPRNTYQPEGITAAENLYYATPHGLIGRNGRDLYHSERWFASDYITALAVHDIDAANGALQIFVGSAEGLSIIDKAPMSLEEKALFYEQMLRDRHMRMGMTADVHIAVPGDLSTSVTHDNDNDGQWTQMSMAAECYRYAVTGDPEAFDMFSQQLDAMLLLESITPISGFPARSIVEPDRCDEKNAGGGEWHLSDDELWCWKGDTSSDELVGHFYGFAICYDVAATDEQKERIAGCVDRMAEHLVDNDFTLVDLDGEPTEHGRFEPEFLNSWYGQLGDAGLNSAMILGFLAIAYDITSREKFLDAYNYLVDEHSYDDNVLRIEEINHTVLVNHDGDEMSFMALFNLITHTDDPEMKAKYLEGMRLFQETQMPERNPEFSIQYLSQSYGFNDGLDQQRIFDDSLTTMLELPLDMLDWQMDASHRVDYEIDEKLDRFEKLQFTEVPPHDERGADRWAENPYRILSTGEGHKEEIPTLFLLPYWMARYYGFWE